MYMAVSMVYLYVHVYICMHIVNALLFFETLNPSTERSVDVRAPSTEVLNLGTPGVATEYGR